MMHHTLRTVSCMLLLVFTLVACGEPPTKALDDAQRSLLDASKVKDCAQTEYAAAQKAMDDAKRLVEEGRFEDAAVKANSAQKLAEKARVLGERECERRRKEEEARRLEEERLMLAKTQLEPVYFAFGQATLDTQAKDVLQKHFRWIEDKKDRGISIRLEGHCDEQGTSSYSLALGLKRAEIVQKYLVQLGLPKETFSVTSFGSELPVEIGSSSQTRNRRVEFRVLLAK